MIKSMTAYARAVKETPRGRWIVEIQTVNRKMLEMNVYLPKELLRFDVEIRKWVAQIVCRGQVTVRVTKICDEASGNSTQDTLSVLHHLKKMWSGIARELGYDSTQVVTLNFLAEQMRLQDVPEHLVDEDSMRVMLQELIEGVLKDLTVMKVIEGKALLKDIEMRLHEIAASLHAIERHVPQTVSRYQQKLEERLREALCLDVKEDERLLKEVVIYAEKLDITEEIVRLQSHLKQFFELVHSEEKSVGRTLDFLTQEMNREINTMAAKSVDADVSLLAVKMKSELEKIREQIQNIE